MIKNNLQNILKDDDHMYFYEFIVIEYVIKKCKLLEYIYNYSCIKDFIKRSVGDFEYCTGFDYYCARFLNTNESLQYVAKYYGYDFFQQIYLEDNYNVTDEGLIGFNPKIIVVENCNITSRGIKNMSNLKELYIRANNKITNEGIENLDLEVLHIGYRCGITNDGLIKQKNIKDLSVCNDTIDDDGISKCHGLLKLFLYDGDLITDNGISKLFNIQELDLSHNDTITV